MGDKGIGWPGIDDKDSCAVSCREINSGIIQGVEGDLDAVSVKVRLPKTPVIALSGKTFAKEIIQAAARLGLRDFYLALDLDDEGYQATFDAVQSVYAVQTENATRATGPRG